MNQKHSQTAILLFAQTAQVDATRKSIADVSVMNVLNKKVLDTIRYTGYDYYHFTENEQRGETFASRFTNSIQDVFEFGYESVICLGNDTPLLTVNLITQAAAHLQHGHAVKGKSYDGGLYLIGLNRSHFDSQKFQNLPWQTASLAVAFHQYIDDQNGNLLVLQSLQDIDSTTDLLHFLAGKDTSVKIIRLLLNTLSQKRTQHKHFSLKELQVLLLQPANKGSPRLKAA